MSYPSWRVALSAVGLAAMTALAVQAQQKTAKPTLTAMDYIEIQQLNERYVHAIDNCIDNGREYASLYTDDGVFVDLWSEKGLAATPDGIRWQGRDKLMEVSGGGVAGCKGWARRQEALSYMINGLVITPSAEGAVGKAYLFAVGVQGDPTKIDREGSYEDTYVKTRDGWRFKVRAHIHKRGLGDPRS